MQFQETVHIGASNNQDKLSALKLIGISKALVNSGNSGNTPLTLFDTGEGKFYPTLRLFFNNFLNIAPINLKLSHSVPNLVLHLLVKFHPMIT